MTNPLGATSLIRAILRRRIARDGLRETARQLGLDPARLLRFARAERELLTGADLDRLIDGLGITVSYSG